VTSLEPTALEALLLLPWARQELPRRLADAQPLGSLEAPMQSPGAAA
jgi:hypothetical protein